MSAGDFDLIFAALQGAQVRHPQDLIALKRSAGRPRDLDDIRELEALAREGKDG